MKNPTIENEYDNTKKDAANVNVLSFDLNNFGIYFKVVWIPPMAHLTRCCPQSLNDGGIPVHTSESRDIFILYPL